LACCDFAQQKKNIVIARLDPIGADIGFET